MGCGSSTEPPPSDDKRKPSANNATPTSAAHTPKPSPTKRKPSSPAPAPAVGKPGDNGDAPKVTHGAKTDTSSIKSVKSHKAEHRQRDKTVGNTSQNTVVSPQIADTPKESIQPIKATEDTTKEPTSPHPKKHDSIGDNTKNESTAPTPQPKTDDSVGNDTPQDVLKPAQSTSDNSDGLSPKIDSEQTEDSEMATDRAAGKKRDVHSTDDNDPMEAAQNKFNSALRLASAVIKPDAVMSCAGKNVLKLVLNRALPPNISTYELLSKLPNLQVVDISRNQMGPQAFRTIILSLCKNKTITSLNIADNLTDTDSAECVGQMLRQNTSLTMLDVSSNSLGKDYFSRCVGPAMAANKSLKVLRCESIGSTDMSVLVENLEKNSTLEELVISHNEFINSVKVAEPLCRWLKNPDCVLKNLECKNCNMNDLPLLTDALSQNSNLTSLDISSNQAADLGMVMDLIVAVLMKRSITTLSCADVRLKSDKDVSWTPAGCDLTAENPGSLQLLHLSNCHLCNDLIVNLCGKIPDGGLKSLTDISLSNNPKLTVKSLEALYNACNGAEECSIERLSWGLNPGDALPEFLSTHRMRRLDYLNLRKAKISPVAVGRLAEHCGEEGIGTLVLDGIKLSRSDAISKLTDPPSGHSGIVALSLGGCHVEDKDLMCLGDAVKKGMELHMLKLTGNRLSDGFVKSFCLVLGEGSRSLALIDLSNNKIGLEGANALRDLLSSGKSKIHSLNLGKNNIPPEGTQSLVGLVGTSTLQSLQLDRQEASYDEEDMEKICTELCSSLGITAEAADDGYKISTSGIPSRLPAHLSLRLQGLGGHPGELGKALDCGSVLTDFVNTRSPLLSLQHAAELAAAFKGYTSPKCLVSSADWANITGAEKGAPTWLRLADHRDRAVFVSRLPASVTVPKMEGLLEMEADCGVDEVVLLTDLVTKKNTGYAWVLMTDTASVDRAVEYTHHGDAIVFGQNFIMSRLNIQVDDDANKEAEAKARKDMEKRLSDRKADSATHQALINRSYRESQARHAYRLAHPAYADGRIW